MSSLTSLASPSSTTSLICRSLPTLLRSRIFSSGSDGCYLIKLSPEIFTEEIFLDMPIEDILSLRQTCRFFYRLTHAPIIWRRFVEKMQFPLPPIRPSFAYTLQETDYEIEQLVSRGISIDFNWRKSRPVFRALASVHSPRVIQDMTLLPGSKFLVVSSKSPIQERYFLEIRSLDNLKRSRVLCQMQIPGKAYNMTAKYMVHEGKYGIVTAFQTRNYPEDVENCNFNPNVFSANANIEELGPLLHKITCVFTPLKVLEASILSEAGRPHPFIAFHTIPDRLPAPFTEIGHMQSLKPFTSMILFEHGIDAYLAAVIQPRTILLYNLDFRRVTTINMKEYEQWSADQTFIHAIHPFPKTGMIYIRSMQPGTLPGIPGAYHCVEGFAFHEYKEEGKVWEVDTAMRLQFREVPDITQEIEFTFVEPDIHSRVQTDLPKNVQDQPRLKPISIFCRSKTPNAFFHWNVWPACVSDGTRTRYDFDFVQSIIAPQAMRMTGDQVPYILSGTERSIVFMVNAEDRTAIPRPLEIYRYVNPEDNPDLDGYVWPPNGQQGNLTGIMRKERLPLPSKRFAKMTLPKGIWDLLTGEGGHGALEAVAWDGNIGRLCFATSKSNCIRVLDFSSCSKPESLLWKWIEAKGKAEDLMTVS